MVPIEKQIRTRIVELCKGCHKARIMAFYNSGHFVVERDDLLALADFSLRQESRGRPDFASVPGLSALKSTSPRPAVDCARIGFLATGPTPQEPDWKS
jgi:hypothetical protein